MTLACRVHRLDEAWLPSRKSVDIQRGAFAMRFEWLRLNPRDSCRERPILSNWHARAGGDEGGCVVFMLRAYRRGSASHDALRILVAGCGALPLPALTKKNAQKCVRPPYMS